MRILAQYAATNPLPTAFCHGPTLLPQPGGDVLGAWFGGTEEGRPDSGIYVARLMAGARAWTPPQPVVPADGTPCGNPVLFEGAPGEVWLVYFRVWGEWCTDGRPCARLSRDRGRTWGSEMVLLDQAGVLTKNKPLRVGNRLLLPVYDEVRWQAGCAWLDLSRRETTWRFDALAIGAGTSVPMIQGTVVEVARSHLSMLMRTKVGRIWRAESFDGGDTWQRAQATSLHNPNAGIDMLKLPNGRVWLCYNDTDRGRDPMQWDLRYPLCVAESADAGESWRNILILEPGPGEHSYPAIVLDGEGCVHIAYTRLRREIRHVVIEP